LYPSAYMVLTNKGYTKHYYAGTERVAARLGGGGLDALYHAIGNNNTIQTKANLLFDQSLEQVNNRILYENNLDCIMSNEFAMEEFGHWIDGIPYQMQADVEFDYKKFKKMVHSMLDDRNHGKEEEVYFYHSDHLGSASWITDSIGIPIQHLQYLPYGEPYVDQRHAGATYSERFRFTGKERDEETGYGYFGARYLDHDLMTMWLSVDPMADKYPSLSPYNYCAWNPIKLTDPNGNEPVKPLIKYYGKGTFMVNTDNLRNVTRKQIELANYNGAHDEGNVGVNLTIGHYSTPKTNPVTSVPLDAVGIDPDHIITQTPPTGNLKRNGQPYYNKYQWNSCAKGAGLGKSAGIAFLAVDVLVYAANMYQMIGINKDNNELRRQTNLLNRAADMVTKAVESGIIFNETQASSNDFLGDVINYIYQGTHVFNGGTVTDRIISPDAINKAKEIMKQNKLDYPLISY
ncbi:MAG: RHS repeat-associated core domain-containing protein, partial [Bacteroidales bacterium]|nr:RHS repeat-associated core domain-containing protein [Bacteroidales bacterium]